MNMRRNGWTDYFGSVDCSNSRLELVVSSCLFKNRTQGLFAYAMHSSAPTLLCLKLWCTWRAAALA